MQISLGERNRSILPAVLKKVNMLIMAFRGPLETLNKQDYKTPSSTPEITTSQAARKEGHPSSSSQKTKNICISIQQMSENDAQFLESNSWSHDITNSDKALKTTICSGFVALHLKNVIICWQPEWRCCWLSIARLVKKKKMSAEVQIPRCGVVLNNETNSLENSLVG